MVGLGVLGKAPKGSEKNAAWWWRFSVWSCMTSSACEESRCANGGRKIFKAHGRGGVGREARRNRAGFAFASFKIRGKGTRFSGHRIQERPYACVNDTYALLRGAKIATYTAIRARLWKNSAPSSLSKYETPWPGRYDSEATRARLVLDQSYPVNARHRGPGARENIRTTARNGSQGRTDDRPVHPHRGHG